MINNKIKNLENNVVNIINESGLPIGIVCLVIDKLKTEADAKLKEVLNQELIQDIQTHSDENESISVV